MRDITLCTHPKGLYAGRERRGVLRASGKQPKQTPMGRVELVMHGGPWRLGDAYGKSKVGVLRMTVWGASVTHRFTQAAFQLAGAVVGVPLGGWDTA